MGLIASLASMVACSESHGNVAIDVEFDSDVARTSADLIELSIVRSCSGIVLGSAIPGAMSWTVERDSQGAPGEIAPGDYAVYGRAIDSQCRVVAAGCSTFTVGAEGGVSVSLALTDSLDDAAKPSVCGQGYACDSTCPGAAVSDASVPDAPSEAGGADCVDDNDCETTEWCDPAGKCADSTSCDDATVDPSLIICEGFEGPAITGWSQGGSESVVLASSRSHRGRASARGTPSATGGSNAFLQRTFPPLTTGTLHLRAHVFIATAEKSLYDIIKVEDQSATDYLSLVVDGGALGVFVAQGDVGLLPQTLPIPTGQWTCIRWEIEYGTDSTIRLFVNGGQREWNGINTVLGVPSAGIGALLLPVPPSAPFAGALDVYVDDVAMGTAPIACDD